MWYFARERERETSSNIIVVSPQYWHLMGDSAQNWGRAWFQKKSIYDSARIWMSKFENSCAWFARGLCGAARGSRMTTSLSWEGVQKRQTHIFKCFLLILRVGFEGPLGVPGGGIPKLGICGAQKLSAATNCYSLLLAVVRLADNCF